jgi:hypothetical protein
MAVDYSALLYDPIYAELGVPATLTLADTDGAEVEITVYDQTRRKALSAGSAEVTSVEPSAFARIPELTGKGIAVRDCYGAVLTFNGRSWIVRNCKRQGSPNGEDFGEVLFLLKEMVSTDG